MSSSPSPLDETLSLEVGALEATLASGRRSAPSMGLAPASIVDRYVVLSMLGAGGMGEVYAAYDPKLDRKVALKLLKSQTQRSDHARARLQREAQALAKLAHPNVVAVHDVGEHEGQLFVSMEFVAGQTLGEWMAACEGPRPWAQVIELFAAAGRGLAAAHASGLIHRDFKPDNVMLGDDGRVRVMDFGLAREADEDEHEALWTARARGLNCATLTQTGSMVGTPAYMSLEQLNGELADARSDQFGYCVALWEALYDERPFVGASLSQLLESLEHQQVRPPPRGTKVPAWIREVVQRGLMPDPAERWPSMDALLAALADDPVLRRRRWLAGAAVVGLLCGGIGSVWYVADANARSCANMDEGLVGVWDAEQRGAVERALKRTGVSYAADTWERVEARLDVYTRGWVEARTQACEATLRGEQSGELLDLRMACLDERLRHTRASVELLARADEAVVEEAVNIVAGLPGIERCADADALRAEVPPPEDVELARRVEGLQQQLAQAKALREAGKYAEGLEQADAVVAAASQLDYEPLMVWAWLRQGTLQGDSGDYASAERTMKQAGAAALGLGMRVEAAEASADLVYTLGYRLARHEEARWWATQAEPLARAAGSEEVRAQYFTIMGAMADSLGEYEQAQAFHERALRLLEHTLDPQHPDVADALDNLGTALGTLGQYEQAREFHERALAIKQEALGPRHPSIASTLNNLGGIAFSQGHHEQARELFERVLAIYEQALSAGHPEMGHALNNLGAAAEALGRHERARELYGRALAIYEQALGPQHPTVATTLANMGNVADSQGRYEEARELLEQALALLEAALGSEHPEVANALTNLGAVAQSQGQHARARELHTRALAIYEQALGPQHPNVAIILGSLGSLAQEQGHYEEARAYYERALAINEDVLGPAHPDVGALAAALGEIPEIPASE